jgi:hypothetical protein
LNYFPAEKFVSTPKAFELIINVGIQRERQIRGLEFVLVFLCDRSLNLKAI